MAQGYSKNQLFQIGKDNYRALVRCCDMLWQEGYWEKPESILNYSINEMLDLYIQAVLVQLASVCGCFHAEECSYIAEIPEQNMIGIMNLETSEDELVIKAQKILKTPPILLQLCSLRDVEHSSSIAGLFFDALLNLLLAMSYLNNSKSVKLTGFILGYYSQVSAFIKTGNNLSYTIDERYVFRKISNDVLECSNELLLASDGDFECYKNKYIYQNAKGKKKDVQSNKNKKEAPKTSNETSNECKSIEETLVQPEHKQAIDKLSDFMEELDSLIGLDSVKTEINSLINMIKVKKLREEYNMPTMDMSYHMVYTGNPGTGKTTVARLVAKIYKELGILTDGNLVETDRSGLVAGYVGQTALKVREVAESAIGGILFIDEAYALSSNLGNNDFGSEAIDTLVKIMEDHRDNLVVIVAGYRDEMQQFLKSNTGLISRFNKFIDFPDYTVDELIQILNTMAGKSGFTIEEKAFHAIKESLDSSMSAEAIKEFGNARGIRNIFEKMVVNHANRVVSFKDPTKEQLSEILLEDTVNV